MIVGPLQMALSIGKWIHNPIYNKRSIAPLITIGSGPTLFGAPVESRQQIYTTSTSLSHDGFMVSHGKFTYMDGLICMVKCRQLYHTWMFTKIRVPKMDGL